MNQTCLVTGASSGIGKVTARELARAGNTVLLVCRNRSKGEATVDEIRRDTGSDKLELLIADLAELRQIRELAAQVKAGHAQLHVLINNAGVYQSARTLTADGYETTFAVNHLAYFLLTIELLDLLKAAAPARIINVASDAHKSGHINFDDLHGSGRYNGLRAYAQSKLANILFTYELARRLQGTGVTVNAMHPGGVSTGIYDNVSGIGGKIIRLFTFLMRTPEKGAETVIWLASSPEVAGVTGKYFYDLKEKPSSRESTDLNVAARLWQISEQLTGLSRTAAAN
ncbi:MAG: SDR family oxidoreductase [Blastocatellia bacterium]